MAVKLYKLSRRYWNGRKEFPAGHVEPFEEGTQPPSAVEVPEPELAPAPVEKVSAGAGAAGTKAGK
jgi:hypothetical protein